MKKIFFILVFLFIGCTGEDRHKWKPTKPWYESNNPTDRTYSKVEKERVILLPSYASIQIPKKWREKHRRYQHLLHSTPKQLVEVAEGVAEWDKVCGSVCNTVFPYDRCAFVAGNDGWGKNAREVTALYLRAYHIKRPVDVIKKEICRKATNEIIRITRFNTKRQIKKNRRWMTIELSAKMDLGDIYFNGKFYFYIRKHKNECFVLVFMLAVKDEERFQKTIEQIVDSFEK